MREEEDRPKRDIHADRDIDSPLQIPAVRLQEIEAAALRTFERALKAEPLEQGADRTEARKRLVDRHQAGGDHAEDEQRVQGHGQKRADQQHQAGDQPDGSLDIPMIRWNDIKSGACHVAKSFSSTAGSVQTIKPAHSNALNNTWSCPVRTRMGLKPRPRGSFAKSRVSASARGDISSGSEITPCVTADANRGSSANGESTSVA